MDQNKNQMTETKKHHFLFHIFRMDKAENPMPKNRAEALLQYLKSVVAGVSRKNKGSD